MRQRQHGITLIELMIVVAIVGILAAIAYPSYRQQVLRSNRTEARVALEERALAAQKCFSRTMSYANAACDAAFAAGDTPNGRYRITTPVRRDMEFTLQAQPLGAQASDAECMNFTLTESGRRGVSGTAAPERCW